ncbi:MAG: integral rane protein [Proteobacteria bacterium]|nr:integral rane protein [Pseudomonadota bacterium]
MNPLSDFHAQGMSLPHIRRIAADRPWFWLRAGWHDLRANPLPSLAYGLLFALGGDLIILALLETPHLLTVSISGFFLVAPLLAAGLYELSRRTEAGEKILFIDSLKCFARNGQSLALFGLILALITLMWERFSAVAFALIGADSTPIASAYLNEILFDGQHLAFTATWFLLGSGLALFVYALAVVSVPLMLDRDADVATAMMTSLRSFMQNTGPLLLWAALLVGLTLLGFATLLFGLVVIMPILGHASWHAYRELVE